MEILGSGLITILNGLLTMLGALASPVAGAVVLAGLALIWLCRLEMDEMGRQSSKPEVGRH